MDGDGRVTAGDEIRLRGWRAHDFHGDGGRLGGIHGSATEPGKVVRRSMAAKEREGGNRRAKMSLPSNLASGRGHPQVALPPCVSKG